MAAIPSRPVMTSPSLGDYSHKHFQSLPTLAAAKESFLIKEKGDEVVANIIKDFFVDAGMDQTFGLAMLHRHFDLEANEKLVDYQGTSTPWQASSRGMKDPQGTIWAFDEDDVLRPVEFRYSETLDAPPTKNDLDFIAQVQCFSERAGHGQGSWTGSLPSAHPPYTVRIG